MLPRFQCFLLCCVGLICASTSPLKADLVESSYTQNSVSSPSIPDVLTDDILSHEAEYDISYTQKKNQPDTIVLEPGVMILKIVRYENKWILTQTIHTLENEADESSRLVSFFTSIESVDGQDYRFKTTHPDADNMEASTKGRAHITYDQRQGTVTYTHPEPEQVELRNETLFPLAYLKTLIHKARQCKDKNFEVTRAYLFDGVYETHHPFDVHAVILKEPSRTIARTEKLEDFAQDNQLFRCEMSLYETDETTREHSQDVSSKPDENPTLKITQIFSHTGVVFKFIIHHDDYIMTATLKKLKIFNNDPHNPTGLTMSNVITKEK